MKASIIWVVMLSTRLGFAIRWKLSRAALMRGFDLGARLTRTFSSYSVLKSTQPLSFVAGGRQCPTHFGSYVAASRLDSYRGTRVRNFRNDACRLEQAGITLIREAVDLGVTSQHLICKWTVDFRGVEGRMISSACHEEQ